MSTIKLEEILATPVKTDDAVLTVQMPGEKLKVGKHTFQLQVTDDAGNVSAPATVLLIVVDNQAPTAVVVARDEAGNAGRRADHGARQSVACVIIRVDVAT